MTSSIKFGLLGLGIVGVGVVALVINRNLKTDTVATADPNAKVIANQAGQVTPGTTPEPLKPQSPSVTTPPSDRNSEHAASPPADVITTARRDDSERSWRPRPRESDLGLPSTPLTNDVSPAPSTPIMTNEPADAPDISTPPSSVLTPPVRPATPPVTETPTTPPSRPGRLSLEPTTPALPTTERSTAQPPATAPAAGKMTVHVVQSGDTLSGLAAKYLGSAKYTRLIAKANPKINPNKLYVGTKLNIPAAPPTATGKPTTRPEVTTTAEKPKPAAPTGDSIKTYTVKKGDSWEMLAKRFLGDGEPWTKLYEMNKEQFPPNSRDLGPGIVLEIPPKPVHSAPGRSTRK